MDDRALVLRFRSRLAREDGGAVAGGEPLLLSEVAVAGAAVGGR